MYLTVGLRLNPTQSLRTCNLVFCKLLKRSGLIESRYLRNRDCFLCMTYSFKTFALSLEFHSNSYVWSVQVSCVKMAAESGYKADISGRTLKYRWLLWTETHPCALRADSMKSRDVHPQGHTTCDCAYFKKKLHIIGENCMVPLLHGPSPWPMDSHLYTWVYFTYSIIQPKCT